ncbi:flagellar hook-associated protein FlgL [Puerhibacterium puerhi]|uniref:flagellar hook-associated protein FlgL n=1 Tax=Puerhibacterium puerhi TaxID=2692623 RepID=UPI00135B23F2|nr:flagellar hook-associated protein FlgL [Puerhibacterium puerhi]
MIGRITHQSIQQQSLANLQRNLSAMSALQSQLSSGKRVTVPSDDPAVANDMLRLRGEQAALNRQQRSIADADAWLSTVDNALAATLSGLRDARDTLVQAGNGAMSQDARNALAAQLEGVREALLDQANTAYIGRQVFAGTSAEPAFDRTTYAFSGTVAGTTPPVERQISADGSVRVDSDGAAVFGVGDDSVFALLDRAAASLRAGEDVADHLGELDARMTAVTTEVSSVGARHARVLEAKDAVADDQVALKARLSAVEDVDLAEAILDLQMQEVAYQGALSATARVLQPTLLDFLR